MRLFGRKEERAEPAGTVQFEDSLLRALLKNEPATRDMALQIPTISGGISLLADTVAGTPVKLFRETGGEIEEIKNDRRTVLLNQDTGDTLNANQFWHALIRDYFLGKGGYAYIEKGTGGTVQAIRYVDERSISVMKNADPVFKSYSILVNGANYFPFEFLKILRNTRDGATGVPITEENSTMIETGFNALRFELSTLKRGGNRKGFLKSARKLDEKAMEALRNAYASLYGNDSDKRENVVVLNDGIDFKESSNSSVEMQLNENKVTNSGEFAKLLHIPTDVISGRADEEDSAGLARLAALPLMKTIECSLNRDLLTETEKECGYYFAFDTQDLLKGSMKERFEAYKIGLESNFMQIDEVRKAENMEPLGLRWIRLGLQDVLYDPATGDIYTPNTGRLEKMEKGQIGSGEE